MKNIGLNDKDLKELADTISISNSEINKIKISRNSITDDSLIYLIFSVLNRNTAPPSLIKANRNKCKGKILDMLAN